MEKRPNYMTVPDALRELEFNQVLFRRNQQNAEGGKVNGQRKKTGKHDQSGTADRESAKRVIKTKTLYENAVEELQKLLDILNYIKADQTDDD